MAAPAADAGEAEGVGAAGEEAEAALPGRLLVQHPLQADAALLHRAACPGSQPLMPAVALLQVRPLRLLIVRVQAVLPADLHHPCVSGSVMTEVDAVLATDPLECSLSTDNTILSLVG